MIRSLTIVVVLVGLFASTAFAQRGAANPLADPEPSLSPAELPMPPAGRFVSRSDDLRLDSSALLRLRVLDASFRNLANENGPDYAAGALSIASGGLSIALGALTNPNDSPVAIYLYTFGASAAVRGILSMALTPSPSAAAIAYSHRSMATEDEAFARIAYGERALNELAERARLTRLLDATLNIVTGIAIVPIYMAPSGFEFSHPLDYFMFIGAALSVVSGALSLTSESAAERRHRSYQGLLRRLRRSQEVDEGLVPAPPATSVRATPLSVAGTF